jgi:transcription-repair coupling factor (superfamily II helicase)
MYCQMLERAVSEMKGEPIVERRPASLHLGVDIKIPENYLGDAGDRLALYKRIAQAADAAEIDRIRADTEDRFGHLPQPARNLFEMAHLRLVAERIGVKGVDLVEDKLQIRFHEDAAPDTQRILGLVTSAGAALTPSGMLILPAPPRGHDRIQAVLGALAGVGSSAA